MSYLLERIPECCKVLTSQSVSNPLRTSQSEAWRMVDFSAAFSPQPPYQWITYTTPPLPSTDNETTLDTVRHSPDVNHSEGTVLSLWFLLRFTRTDSSSLVYQRFSGYVSGMSTAHARCFERQFGLCPWCTVKSRNQAQAPL